MPHVAKCVMKLSFEQLAYFEGSCSSQTEVIIVDTASFFLLHLPLILDNVVCVLDLGAATGRARHVHQLWSLYRALYLFVCLSLSVGCREISQSLFLPPAAGRSNAAVIGSGVFSNCTRDCLACQSPWSRWQLFSISSSIELVLSQGSRYDCFWSEGRPHGSVSSR